jgi:predicted NACHT family NTPase
LVFEESADFPSNRSELYKEGLDVLLKKWDAKRILSATNSISDYRFSARKIY